MDIEDLKNSLKTSFIDRTHSSKEEYRTKLIINNKDKTVSNEIIKELNELESGDEFYFNVAFITQGAINILEYTFNKLRNLGIKGKILTSEYLTFTEPKALERLKEYKNIELKIFEERENAHQKAYIFKKKKEGTIILGSSNLTTSALSRNNEWNLKLNSTEDGELYNQVLNRFENEFNSAIKVTSKWLEEYKVKYNKQKEYRKQFKNIINKEEVERTCTIKPNLMQEKALKELEKVRNNNGKRALVISATGTGKTYLAALDVKVFNPKKMLFIVHRDVIARKACESFKKIFPDVKTGFYNGEIKDNIEDVDFLFANSSTMQKEEYYTKFDKKIFDYIIIDEAHHSSASGYTKIINYFEPKFLLGMTATPERMDDGNIFELFDYNIAYNLRLKEAMENNLLAPFQYFGISELQVGNELYEDKKTIDQLEIEERVKQILKASDKYGYSGEKLRCLIFGSSVEDNKLILNEMKKRDYKVAALSGSDSNEERERVIKQLEDGKINYLLTVNIFNEGVDIPSVNQIIMIRSTQSPIIFVQQLGRGLRKYQDKEYTVVIDIIGNYENNYMLPIALYGDRTYDKDVLRRLVMTGGNTLPGMSFVRFDKIAEERIYNSINNTNISTLKLLKEDYEYLRKELNRIPLMVDWFYYGSRDGITFCEKFKSYYEFLDKVDKEFNITEKEKDMLGYLTSEVLKCKRIEDINLLNLINNKEDYKITYKEFIDFMNKKYGYKISIEIVNNIIKNLNNQYLIDTEIKKYKDKNIPIIIKVENDNITFDKEFINYLDSKAFKICIKDLIEYGILDIEGHFNKEKFIDGFTLYEKYTRKDVLKILHYDRNMPGQNIGGYHYNKEKKVMPVFITYNKVKGKINYEDRFINNSLLIAFSKNNRNSNSPEIIGIQDKSLRIPLFVKKSDDEGQDFYYLGDVKCKNYAEGYFENNNGENVKRVKILYELKEELPEWLLNYITENNINLEDLNAG